MNRKILGLALVLGMSAALGACGGGTETPPPAPDAKTTTPAAPSPAATTPATTPRPTTSPTTTPPTTTPPATPPSGTNR